MIARWRGLSQKHGSDETVVQAHEHGASTRRPRMLHDAHVSQAGYTNDVQQRFATYETGVIAKVLPFSPRCTAVEPRAWRPARVYSRIRV